MAKNFKSRTFTDKQLIAAVRVAHSYREVLKLLQLCGTGAGAVVIKRHIVRLGLDVSHFSNRSKLLNRSQTLQELLTKGSNISSKSLKTRLIAADLFVEQCFVCKLTTWQGAAISLHLDHINGDRTDQRIENLRLLCPNCHSQTPTFGARNSKRKKRVAVCTDCGASVSAKSKQCIPCYNKWKSSLPAAIKLASKITKIMWPDPSEIARLVWELPATQIAKKLGVSDNALGRFCRTRGISKPGRGYWAKQKSLKAA